MYCEFLFLPCQTESSQRLHHRAQSSRSAVSAAALWQVRRGESRSAPRLFVDECWLLSTRMRAVVVVVLTKWSALSQDKDAALSPSELKNLFCVCPYMPWGAEVYLTVPTTGQGYISNVGYRCQWTYVSHSAGEHFDAIASALLRFSRRRPPLPCTASHVVSLPSHAGCLHTLTSTAAWSTWGTWATPSWLSRSHRRLPSQVCLHDCARLRYASFLRVKILTSFLSVNPS